MGDETRRQILKTDFTNNDTINGFPLKRKGSKENINQQKDYITSRKGIKRERESEDKDRKRD